MLLHLSVKLTCPLPNNINQEHLCSSASASFQKEEEESMPPRLQHTKSRTGCRRCKERRVKCDEVHPACGSCRAHKVDCVYQSSSRRTTVSAASLDGAPASISVVKMSGGAMRRLSELRLLHHFITNVAPTLPTSYPDRQPTMWATGVVDLALQPENSFLLHTVFAISALHWTVINSLNHPTVDDPWTPPSVDSQVDESKLEAIGLDLAKAHRLYLDLAVQEHRLKMSVPPSENHNSDTMYLTSVLMLLIAIRMNAVQGAEEYTSSSVQWRRMARAMSLVDLSKLGLLAKDAYAALNLDASQRTPRYEWEEVLEKPQYQMMKAILEFEAGGDSDSAVLNKEDVYAYAKAAEYVGLALMAGSEGAERGYRMARRIMAFPAEVPDRFIELLEEKDSRAFVIFTHLMACATYIDADKNWWLEGVADRCKARIITILPEKWHWALPRLEKGEGPGTGRGPYLCFLDSLDVSM